MRLGVEGGVEHGQVAQYHSKALVCYSRGTYSLLPWRDILLIDAIDRMVTRFLPSWRGIVQFGAIASI